MNIEDELASHLAAMRFKLALNRHRGLWADQSLRQLFNKLHDEVNELFDELMTISGPITSGRAERIALECADVSNYALMIASVARRLSLIPGVVTSGDTTEAHEAADRPDIAAAASVVYDNALRPHDGELWSHEVDKDRPTPSHKLRARRD